MVLPSMAPEAGSIGPVPETNTRPAALTAWLYVAGGLAAFDVNTICLAISVPGSVRTTSAMNGTGVRHRPGSDSRSSDFLPVSRLVLWWFNPEARRPPRRRSFACSAASRRRNTKKTRTGFLVAAPYRSSDREDRVGKRIGGYFK